MQLFFNMNDKTWCGNMHDRDFCALQNKMQFSYHYIHYIHSSGSDAPRNHGPNQTL